MENDKNDRIRILIVDDDLNVIEDVLKCIHSLDTTIKPVVADAPGKALELIKREPFFDLILVDYVFTGSPVTGIEIFEEIKKIYRSHIHVGVLITGCGTAGLFVHEQAADLFSDCIEKPFAAFDNLKEKISKAISLLTRKQEADAGKLTADK